MRYLLAIKMFLLQGPLSLPHYHSIAKAAAHFESYVKHLLQNKNPSIISDAKILIGHLNLMTLLLRALFDSVL